MSQPARVVADGTKILLGKGAVYFDRLDASGIRTGEMFLGNCTSFEISGTEETREKYGTVDSTAPLLQRIVTKRTFEVSIELNEINQGNLSLALVGTKMADDVQTGATAGSGAGIPVGGAGTGWAAQPLVNADVWYPTGKRDWSAVTGVKHTTIGGVSAGIEGVDWEFDKKTGRVYIPASKVGVAKLLWVEGTYGTNTKTPVSAGDGTVKGYIRFVGDPAAGPVVGVEIWSAIVSPDGAFSLIGDDFASYRMKAAILSDAIAHPTAPYFRVMPSL